MVSGRTSWCCERSRVAFGFSFSLAVVRTLCCPLEWVIRFVAEDMERPRIYADFMGLGFSPRDPARQSVPLDTFGSIRDLSNAAIRLHDGVRLTIYSDSDESEDLNADVFVYFDRASGIWHAELEQDAVSHVPRHEDDYAGRFLCVACRSAFPIGAHGYPSAETCPSCDTPWVAAIAAPGSFGTPGAI
jgi:hypothetical protein